MHVHHPDAEPRRGRDRACHGIRNVVEFQVEEDFAAGADEVAYGARSFGDEELLADLEGGGALADGADDALGVRDGRHVQGDDQAVGRGEGRGHLRSPISPKPRRKKAPVAGGFWLAILLAIGPTVAGFLVACHSVGDFLAVDDIDPDLFRAPGSQFEHLGRAVGEVDDAVPDIGAAVVHAYGDGTAVPQVRDPNPCA